MGAVLCVERCLWYCQLVSAIGEVLLPHSLPSTPAKLASVWLRSADAQFCCLSLAMLLVAMSSMYVLVCIGRSLLIEMPQLHTHGCLWQLWKRESEL